MSADELANVLEIIGFFFGLGWFIDQVVWKSEPVANDGVLFPLKGSLTKFLTVAHQKLFIRYFGDKPLSAKYIYRCVIFSLLSTIIVIVLQYISNGDEVLKFFSNEYQLYFFISLAVFNIVFDWVSIFQTQVFLQFAYMSRSIFRSIIALFADVILTINAFVIFYSIFIFLSLFVLVYMQNHEFDDKTAKVDIKVSSVPTSPEKSDIRFVGWAGLVGEESYSSKVLSASVSNDLDGPEILDVFERLDFFKNFRVTSILLVTAYGPYDYSSISEFREADLPWSEIQNYNMYLTGSIEKIEYNFSVAYPAIYVSVDAVENQLWDYINPYFFFTTPLSSFVDHYEDKHLNFNVYICKEKKDECGDDAYFFEYLDYRGQTSSILEIGSFFGGLEAPINTLFISSIFTNLILYFLIFSFFIINILGSVGFFRVFRQRVLMKAPFALSGLVLGSTISFIV